MHRRVDLTLVLPESIGDGQVSKSSAIYFTGWVIEMLKQKGYLAKICFGVDAADVLWVEEKGDAAQKHE